MNAGVMSTTNSSSKLFVQANDEPYIFFVDRGPDIPYADRGELLKLIRKHGGKVEGIAQKVDIIVVPDGTDVARAHAEDCRKLAASGGRRIVALDLGWVEQCIHAGRLFNNMDWGGCKVVPPPNEEGYVRPKRSRTPLKAASCRFNPLVESHDNEVSSVRRELTAGPSTYTSRIEADQVSTRKHKLSMKTSIVGRGGKSCSSIVNARVFDDVDFGVVVAYAEKHPEERIDSFQLWREFAKTDYGEGRNATSWYRFACRNKETIRKHMNPKAKLRAVEIVRLKSEEAWA